ncbi:MULTISPECIES: hypothetical protein [Virgibacillus]|uniref:hypothetical protein n=1 Tax=Virgibacillus TaxID=84406 RepID=UPI0017F0AD34|nr:MULTISPECIES: hypothetical protein [Virgibacillus]MBU5265966.1 hypothetical protein [Virgibacillus proomii]NWO15093.1 hypothetical protein [Virgibacillus sp.]
MKNKNHLPKPLNQIDKFEIINDSKIIIYKYVSEGDYFLQGHFPEKSIFPGLLMVEAIKQSIEQFLKLRESDYSFRNVSARFLKIVSPADILKFVLKKEMVSKTEIIINCIGTVEQDKVMAFKANIIINPLRGK